MGGGKVGAGGVMTLMTLGPAGSSPGSIPLALSAAATAGCNPNSASRLRASSSVTRVLTVVATDGCGSGSGCGRYGVGRADALLALTAVAGERDGGEAAAAVVEERSEEDHAAVAV